MKHASRPAAKLLLVARREIRARARSRALRISTAVVVLMMLVVGVINRASHNDTTANSTIAVIGAIPPGFAATVEKIAATTGQQVIVLSNPLADEAAAASALRDGTVDAVVDAATSTLQFHTRVDPATAALISAAWGRADARQVAISLGLTPAQVDQVTAPPPLTVTTISPPKSENGLGRLVGMVAAVLLFFCVSTFGALVLTGVVEEKSSAVVEILLSHVRAHVLLAGKVLGIGTIALAQFAVFVVAGLASLKISGTSVPTAVWVSLPTTMGWFIGGFALYSMLFALAGSLVSRQEDAQAASAPITIVFVVAYLLVFLVSGNPGATAPTILSMVPPLAPLLMPLRMATGSAAVWQVAVAAALLIGAIYGVLRAAGAVYATTLLHRGSRISWGQALRRTAPPAITD
ncbi:MAG: ABC transporter permease [Ilumatobacteraceae bacterium]